MNAENDASACRMLASEAAARTTNIICSADSRHEMGSCTLIETKASYSTTRTIATNEDPLSLEVLVRQIFNRLLGIKLHQGRRSYISHSESVCCKEGDKPECQMVQMGQINASTSDPSKGFAYSRIFRRMQIYHLRAGANALAWKAVAARARMTDLENFMVLV